MKNLSLAGVLYLSIASVAFADSNTLDITQASVGTAAPTTNFTQSGTNGFADISQTGANVINGVQLGTGTQFNATQQNPTSGAANTINYTGNGNSQTTVSQHASNGILTASGAAGNTANINMANNPYGSSPNSLSLDQIGYNNTATVYDNSGGLVGNPSKFDAIKIAQYSDNAASGNMAQVVANGVGGSESSPYIIQQGGNIANMTINGTGGQPNTLTQTNTADNAAVANTVNLTTNGAGFVWSQNGTLNSLTANLTGTVTNTGLTGWQTGNGNTATVTQNVAYLDTTANTLDQTGNNNTATATQNNTHDSLFSIIQNGNNDTATITQSGTSNVANLTQTGNLNTASITQSGTGATAIIHQ